MKRDVSIKKTIKKITQQQQQQPPPKKNPTQNKTKQKQKPFGKIW